MVKAERSATRLQSRSKVQVIQMPTSVPGLTLSILTTRAWRRQRDRDSEPRVSPKSARGYAARYTHVLPPLVTERNQARLGIV